MPRIKITGGPPHITRVSIGDEEVAKNTDVEVSDEFVARLEKEFPELTCETLKAEPAGTGSGQQTADPNNDPNKTEPSGQQGLGGAPGRTGVNE